MLFGVFTFVAYCINTKRNRKSQDHVQQNLIPDTPNNETHVLNLKPICTTPRLSSSYNSRVWTKQCYPKVRHETWSRTFWTNCVLSVLPSWKFIRVPRLHFYVKMVCLFFLTEFLLSLPSYVDNLSQCPYNLSSCLDSLKSPFSVQMDYLFECVDNFSYSWICRQSVYIPKLFDPESSSASTCRASWLHRLSD